MAQFALNLALNLNDFKARLGDVRAGLSLLASAAAEPLRKIQEIGNSVLEQIRETSQAAASDQLAAFQFDRVFGAGKTAAADFAEGLANSFDRANGDMQKFMAQAKFMADGLGFTQTKAVDLSAEVVKLALNFADFANVSDAEALSVVQQALLGNTRGLKQFGIALDDADLKARALAQGLDPEKLTQQQTALLALSFLTERMGAASGAAAGKQQTFAGALRGLKTQLDELKDDLGQSVNSFTQPFAAAATGAVKSLRGWIAEFPNLSAAAMQTATVLGAAASGLGAVFGTLASAGESVGLLAVAWGQLGGKAGVGAAATKLLEGGLGAVSKAASMARAPLGVLGAAIAGWELGTAIDGWLGISAAFAKAAKTAGEAKSEMAFAAGLNRDRAAVENTSAAYAALARNTLTLKEAVDSNAQATANYQFLQRQQVGDFKALLGATDEFTMLQILEANSGKLNAEGLAKLTELRTKYADKLREGTAAQKENTKATLSTAEALAQHEEALKRAQAAQEAAKQAETALEDARVKATATLDDDLNLLQQRAWLAEAAAKSDDERQLLARKADLERTTLLEQNQRDLQAAAKSANEAAQGAQDALLQARAQATKSLQDDLALMRERAAREVALAKSVEERAAIERKWLYEERALIEANARTQAKSLGDFLKAQQAALQKQNGQGTQADLAALANTWKEQAGNVTTAADLKRFQDALAHAFDEPLNNAKQALDELNQANPSGNSETSARALQLLKDQETARKLTADILKSATDSLKEVTANQSATQSASGVKLPGTPQAVTDLKNAGPALPTVTGAPTLTDTVSQILSVLRDLAADVKTFVSRLGQSIVAGTAPIAQAQQQTQEGQKLLNDANGQAQQILSGEIGREDSLANLGQALLANLAAIRESNTRQDGAIAGILAGLQVQAANATDLQTAGLA